MSFLHIVAYAATLLGFCFLVLSLACGLYYLAELVEEYTVYTKKVIKVMTTTVVAIHVLLWIVDRLPFLQLAFSILCHGIYTKNLETFPFISLTSPYFIASCVLVFVDHFVWFQYFTTHYRPFMDIAAFFGVCVWLIPFTYFISLSANDNALPTSNSAEPNVEAIPAHQKKGLFRSIVGVFGSKNETELPTVPPPMYHHQAAAHPPPPQSVPASSSSIPTSHDIHSNSWSSVTPAYQNSSTIQHRKVA